MNGPQGRGYRRLFRVPQSRASRRGPDGKVRQYLFRTCGRIHAIPVCQRFRDAACRETRSILFCYRRIRSNNVRVRFPVRPGQRSRRITDVSRKGPFAFLVFENHQWAFPNRAGLRQPGNSESVIRPDKLPVGVRCARARGGLVAPW